MFKFFTNKDWFLWSWLGGFFILLSTWYQVQLDVKINEWFGEFYDTLQKALAKPGSVTLDEFISYPLQGYIFLKFLLDSIQLSTLIIIMIFSFS